MIPKYSQRAAAFAARVRDVHEYLVDIGFAKPAGRIERTVTYQDSCHLSHAQGIRKPPRDVLRSIPGTHPERDAYSRSLLWLGRHLLGRAERDITARPGRER